MKWCKRTTKVHFFSCDKNNHLNRSNLETLILHKIANTGLTFTMENPKVHSAAIAGSFCLAIAYILQIIALVNAKDDIDRLFECFSFMSFCGMGILKLISLYSNHKQWNLLLNMITKLIKDECSKEETSTAEYDSEDEENSHFPTQIDSYTVSKFQTLSTLLPRMYGFTAVICILSPFAEYFILTATQAPAGWPHIFTGWAPFDGISFIGYFITICIEFVAAVYCVFIHIAFDLTSIGIMIFICGQFRLLRDYSENIGGRGKQWQLSRRRDERAHHRIARCHKIHDLLMTLTDGLSKILKHILGIYFYVATLTLCSVAVRLNSELRSMQLVSLLQYICATLTQLFLFCRYGDNVLHEGIEKRSRRAIFTNE